MSECMIDYVGLRPCNFIPSLSKMYLDQLPGIEIANIDGIADAEQLTYVGVWNDLQATAADTFREDVIEEFGKRYLLKQIVQSVDLGKNIDVNTLTAPIAGSQYGVLFELNQQGDQCSCSNLQSQYVQAVNFYWSGTNGSPSITLNFQDADLGTILYTTTVVAVAGWNQIWIDQQFDAQRMYVFVSGNFDNYVDLDLSLFNVADFGTGNWGFYNGNTNWMWYNFGGCGCQARIQGATYNTAANTNSTGLNTFGVSVIFSTKCTFDSIVCANKKSFASAWQHCLAIELLNYRINSTRLNRWTTINKQQAIELQKLYTLKYRGGMDKDTGLSYPGKLQSAITSVILNDADCCLTSNDYLIWRESRF